MALGGRKLRAPGLGHSRRLGRSDSIDLPLFLDNLLFWMMDDETREDLAGLEK